MFVSPEYLDSEVTIFFYAVDNFNLIDCLKFHMGKILKFKERQKKSIHAYIVIIDGILICKYSFYALPLNLQRC